MSVSFSLLVNQKRMQYIDFSPFLPLVATRTQSILVSCIKKKEKETTMNHKGVQHLSRLLWLQGDGLLCATLSPSICRAQWLRHKTHLGEGGPRHRLAVLSSWFVSQQRSVSGPRLKVASRCGESRGLWQAAQQRWRGAPERHIRKPFGIWNGLSAAFNSTVLKKNKKKDTTLLLQLATIVPVAGKWPQRHKGKIY